LATNVEEEHFDDDLEMVSSINWCLVVRIPTYLVSTLGESRWSKSNVVGCSSGYDPSTVEMYTVLSTIELFDLISSLSLCKPLM